MEGETAYHIAVNFEERWKKQAPVALRGELINLLSDEFDLKCAGSDVSDENGWKCQLFR